MARIAKVIVPLPLEGVFSYLVPEAMIGEVVPWSRVVVPFGKGRVYTGIVAEVEDTDSGICRHSESRAMPSDCIDNSRAPALPPLKEVLWCPDGNRPILRRGQLNLWEWMAEYYMCSVGEVMKAALPGGLSVECETIVEASCDPDVELPELRKEAVAVWEAVRTAGSVSVRQLERSGLKNVMRGVYDLMDTGLVSVREKLSERICPRREEYYELTIPREGDNDALAVAFGRLRSARHQDLLMTLVKLSGFTNRVSPLREVSREAVAGLECYDRAVLRSFVKRGWLKINTRLVSKFGWEGSPLKVLPELSTAQKEARDSIRRGFVDKGVMLLHGVTSSGKTEVYIHLIDEVLQAGRQVLFLVPEIALTTQLTRRLQEVFGSKVIVYHSRFSDRERVGVWRKMLENNDPVVVVGARSSVFLPFASLGLIIVDEEHEQSFKQVSPAPRYNGRDVAIMLARSHGAKTLLGSATPAVETYYKALTGLFGLVSLSERYGNVSLPEIEIVDMRGSGPSPLPLSARGTDIVRQAVARGEQAIIFHNRRGYSPMARCKGCEFVPRCTDCDVSLTYHKGMHRLVCHYCGKEYGMPDLCPVCGGPTMEIVGFGTERIEDEIADVFHDARTIRMDLDTTRNKGNYIRIIEDFSDGKADILIGTQMVTKGLDFGGVSTVVTLNADMLINYPDFRSGERAWDMLEQVSGRAGRRSGGRGRVIIQTRQPDHPILGYVVNHDYAGFYNHEIEERESFKYPPFVRIIYIYVRHKDAGVCRDAAENFASDLRARLGDRVLGPHEPPVNRVRLMYMRRIMVKIENGVSLSQIKKMLREGAMRVRLKPGYKAVDIYFDVDPM